MKNVQAIDSEIQQKNYEHELQLCQNAGGDIEKYRRLHFDVLQLEQIRLGLEAGIDVDSYLNPNKSWMEMEAIRTTLETGIDMKSYIKQGFNWFQCTEIRKGIKENLDVSVYAHTYFLVAQMKEIRIGMEKGLNVQYYANQQYDWYQMREIRRGLEEQLDVSKYASPKYKYLTMRAIREGLRQKIDLVPYVEKGYSGKILMEICRGISMGNEIIPYLEKGYDAEQLKQINNAYEVNVNIFPYLYLDFQGVQLQEIIKGLQKGLDVSVYAKKEFNWFQMRELRRGLEDKIDVRIYADPDFSFRQMREIRKGLVSGVDVSEYAKVFYEPKQMEEFRIQLEEKGIALSDEMEEMLRNTLSDGGKEDEWEETKKENSRDYVFDSQVSISEDKMKAIIYFSQLKELIPEELEQLTYSDVIRILNQHNVKQGIKKERIAEILEKKHFDKDIVAAEGKPPVDGEDGHFVYYFKKELNRRPKVLTDGSVDYKNMELFQAVKKDQLVAEYHNAASGTFGYDVTGQLIAPKRGKDLPTLRGQGFQMTEDKKKYYAAISGIIDFKEESHSLTIRNLYTVPGNVDASTGNINFNGDVNVTGNVEPGFTITAAGSVVVDGHCEGCSIHAGKDIVIKRGCQGRGIGELHAEGNVTGQFFESTTIKAGCNVEASYLLNCQVKAGGKLLVEGRKGVILGGYICAKQGVNCFGIGNVAEIKTIVETGIDKEDMMVYQELVKTLEKIDAEIRTCESALNKFMLQPVRDEKVTALCERLTKAVYTQKLRKKKLMKEQEEKKDMMTKQRGARIAVTGRIYPGTILFLNSDTFKIKEIYSNVEFVKKDNKVDLVPR